MLPCDREPPRSSLRVAIATLGCKVNQYDSVVIGEALRGKGCVLVDFNEPADVYIVNTCSVTDRADAESLQLARRARRRNPVAKVLLTGCFAQVAPQRAAIPEVDGVIGLNRLGDLVAAALGPVDSRIAVSDLRQARKVRTVGVGVDASRTRAFLKVQEGCDLFCSFCIVPMSRGASRSVPPREIIEQYETLASLGVKEVVLTGVHLGTWGQDLSPRLELADLVEMILERGCIPRVRLSSIDPPEVSPRLVRLFETSEQLCPHFHIPIQAGVDSVLQRMRRRYDTSLVRSRLEEIRGRLPDAAIGTDVIAGFPGETDDDFARGHAFLESLPLTYFHVFPYSPRQGTTAAKLPGQLPRHVVHARARALRKLGESKKVTFAQRFVGRELLVLFEDQRRDTRLCTGYSRNYQRVRVAEFVRGNRELPVWITGVDEAGQLIGEVSQRFL
ncbi:MAG: tRNA (N(6)-L-threonylcarbamoyladenosine(37)-C(2))-methylthiotransferase MtaB [Candidatus Binatia bacterium]|nr:MAG: tRNA (N(6)-L-threonylcarbamoyladenosine(37)-C(2))-methylthiotransferase MtaB [Candidatus Binatia bacterium]